MIVRKITLINHRHAVGAHLQRSLRRDRGFFLSQAARRCISGIYERFLTLIHQPLVKLIEPGLGHVNLTPDLNQVGNALASQFQGNRWNGADIGSDIFAGIAVTPGRGFCQPALLIMQADRKAIELGSQTYSMSSTASKRSRTRRSKSRNSSSLKALSSDNMGMR